jgi:LysM repeat protein
MDNLDTLKNEVQIQESQITTFEEKFKNLDDIIDSLRHETTIALQAVKESLRNHSTHLDAKLSDQNNSAKGLSQEIKSLANDNIQVLNDFKKRIADIETSIELQNRNVENLQSALSSLIEAIKGKEVSTDETSAKIYRVKAGDSLEKIAKQNQTTIKKLKEANNLTGDQILVGQKLKIPE